MLEPSKIALNRILLPSAGLKEFYRLARDVGIGKVELRNDLPGGAGRIIDGFEPRKALELARGFGLEVITINALQKFNLPSARAAASEELDSLLDFAAAVECRALVLCPNCDPSDSRTAEDRRKDTAEALASFGPRFKARGILGYVEPLGFGISSLSSIKETMDIIRETGFDCYRVLHDTFHNYLGPEASLFPYESCDPAMVGLVHASGIDEAIPKNACRDDDRVLPSPLDVMKSKEQVLKLASLGYSGDVSLEPFGRRVQELPLPALKDALKKSIAYLLS